MNDTKRTGIDQIHEVRNAHVSGMILEAGKGSEHASVGAVLSVHDHARLHPNWTIRKWRNQQDYQSGKPPREVLEFDDNVFLNAGITALLNIAVGIAATAWSSSGWIAAGTGTATANATQSGPSATGTASASAQLTGAPTVSSQTATFIASFASNLANFAWGEILLANSAGTYWNRLVQVMGTKASPAVWTATLTISVA